MIAGTGSVEMDIRMLGALSIRDGESQLSLGGQRRKCLLAVLLLNHGRTVSRSDLADWAWPATPPDSVDRQIANYISALRSVRLVPMGDVRR